MPTATVVSPKKSPLVIISLIAGILSILMAWFWFIALPLAILAIVLGIVGHKQQKQGGMWVAGVATGSIGVLFSVVAAGMWLLFGGLLATAGNTSYSSAVDQLRDSQTLFSQNETAKIGPLDVKVVSIEHANKTSTGEDVIVTLSFSASDTPIGEGVLGTGWTSNLSRVELNGKTPRSIDVPSSETGYIPDEGDLKQLGTQTIVLTYRVYLTDAVPAGEDVLTYTTSYFTRVSAIVGTEGAPSEDITYTIKLDQ